MYGLSGSMSKWIFDLVKVDDVSWTPMLKSLKILREPRGLTKVDGVLSTEG